MQLTRPSNSLTLLAYKSITPYTPNDIRTINNKVEDGPNLFPVCQFIVTLELTDMKMHRLALGVCAQSVSRHCK